MLTPHPKILQGHKLDFRDVLIVPKKTQVTSRSKVLLERKFTFPFSNQQWSGIPIISSNMDTVTSIDTFNVLNKRKYLTCFPKYLNDEWISSSQVPSELANVDGYMLSCGTNSKEIRKFVNFLARLHITDIKPKFICIDVANGYITRVAKVCAFIRKILPEVILVAGNVVTPEGVKELVTKGSVDIVKIGIGSGLLCTTRKITGVGYPQLSAVLECADEAHSLGALVISDGGVTLEGDISKAFCAGGDFVMLGSMLAGHNESPGEIKTKDDGTQFKMIYGMSSSIANEKYAGGIQWYKAPEGKVVEIPYRGSLEHTLQRIEGGIRSACSYIGARSVDEMTEKGSFILVHRQYNNALDAFVISE